MSAGGGRGREMHRSNRAQSQAFPTARRSQRIATMSENARRLGRPSAADDVARIVLESAPRAPAIISRLREKELRKRLEEDKA